MTRVKHGCGRQADLSRSGIRASLWVGRRERIQDPGTCREQGAFPKPTLQLTSPGLLRRQPSPAHTPRWPARPRQHPRWGRHHSHQQQDHAAPGLPTPTPAALPPGSLHPGRRGTNSSSFPHTPRLSPNPQAGASPRGEVALSRDSWGATPHEGECMEQPAGQPPGHEACPPQGCGSGPDST